MSNLDATTINSSVQVTQAYQQSLVAASLYIDYVFLDTDERRKMAQNPHEYLIEQLQFTGDESVGSSSNKIKLNFNHPVKELVWVVQPDANVDYCSSLLAGSTLFRTLGAQPFNYTDAIDALPNAIHAFGGPLETTGANGFITSSGLFQMPGAVDALLSTAQATTANNSTTSSVATTANPTFNLNVAATNILAVVNSAPLTTVTINGQTFLVTTYTPGAPNASSVTVTGTLSAAISTPTTVTFSQVSANNPSINSSWGTGAWSAFDPTSANATTIAPATNATGSGVSDAGTFVLAETALDMHCWGQNPVVTAKLQLNGQDRFSEREGSYFDVVQPFQHHSRAPDTGINVYSFALRPEEHQPSGSCNFSRIDNATLQLVLSAPTVSGTATAKVRVYAVNYNVLRVMSGMAGQAYSN